jgi:acetyltransferase-like isoleucine patch superfamily enzyme
MYIYDAKYYKLLIKNNKIINQPGIESITKQYLYHLAYKKFNTSPIKIGKNCWLGSNVIVLKGVEIGNNCVIGAGCIIYKNIPAGSVVINNQELMIKNQKE